MTWLIIGSVAAYHWFPDYRKPLDIDLLTEAKISGNHSKTCVVDAQWHEVAEEIIRLNKDPVFADPSVLFTLKVSHAEWDVKWDKTMFDIGFFQNKGVELDYELLAKLKPVWKRIHGDKRVNLNQKVEDFFKDAVTRKFPHELIHELVAFNGRPMHELIRPNPETVWCSEADFKQLPEKMQLETAMEEMIVTAIERYNLSPASKRSDKLIALSGAYKKLVTSMTTGWFALFLILNRKSFFIHNRDKMVAQLNQTLEKLYV